MDMEKIHKTRAEAAFELFKKKYDKKEINRETFEWIKKSYREEVKRHSAGFFDKFKLLFL